MPKPQQLVFDFSFSSDEQISIVPEECAGWLRWTTVPNQKAKRFTVKPEKHESFLVEVGQRKRSYHAIDRASIFTTAYGPFLDHFIYKTTGVKPKTDNYSRNSERSKAFPHNQVWMPAFLRLNVDDESPSYDFCVSIYNRNQTNRGEVRGGSVARVLIHTTYVAGSDGTSIDRKNSYMALSHDTLHPGVFVATFDEIGSGANATPFVMPWSSLFYFNGGSIPKSFTEPRSIVADYFSKKLKLNGLGAELQKSLFTTLSNQGFRTTGTQSVESELLSLCISARSMGDMVYFLLPDDLQNTEGNRGRVFTRHILGVLGKFLADGPPKRSFKPTGRHYHNVRPDGTVDASETVQTWMARVRGMYGLLWDMYCHYETPNVLDMYSVEDIYNGPPIDPATGRAGGAFSSYQLEAKRTTVRSIMEMKWFQGFPLPKQWRLLGEAIAAADQYQLRDIGTMVAKIEAADIDIDEHISRRDVKTITQFHDEVVKVYNTVRYAPVPVKADHSLWLTEYGLDVNDDMELVLPETSNDIRTWGQVQGHCIGSYSDHAVNGSQILLGVRDKKTKNWIGHLQISPNCRLKKHSIERDKLEKPRNERVDPYRRTPVVPATGMIINQFYGLRNSQVPQEKKDPVVNHLREAAIAYFFKPEKEAENAS